MDLINQICHAHVLRIKLAMYALNHETNGRFQSIRTDAGLWLLKFPLVWHGTFGLGQKAPVRVREVMQRLISHENGLRLRSRDKS